MAEKKVTKVTLNLPDELVDFVKKIADKENITITNAIQRAINFEKFYVEQEHEGNKFLIEGKDKKIREIVRK